MLSELLSAGKNQLAPDFRLSISFLRYEESTETMVSAIQLTERYTKRS